ncbi:MAG: anti-sigma factor [Siphonobacter sp.]
MNEQELVSSGLLESYVLGCTTEDEKLQVKQLLAWHPEYQERLEEVQNLLEDYAWEMAKEPPAELRGKIISQIQPLSTRNVKPTGILEQTFTPYRNWVAAAAVFIVLSFIGNFFLFQKLQQSKDRIALLENDNNQLASNLKVQKASFINIREEIAVLQNPGTKLIKLKGEPIAPTAFAMLYWNHDKSETYLANVQLPKVPEDKQYQLWAIVNGKHVNAGVYDPVTSIQKVKNIQGASSFAISLEPKGNETKEPTGKVYLKGDI